MIRKHRITLLNRLRKWKYALLHVPGADHILAQSLKRCSISRIKPDETFELAKKRRKVACFGVWKVACFGVWKRALFWGVKTCFVLGCAGETICLRFRQVTQKVRKTVKNLLVLQFCSWNGSFRRNEIKIWLCLYFQHVARYIGTDFVEESRQKNAKIRKGAFFSRRVLW